MEGNRPGKKVKMESNNQLIKKSVLHMTPACFMITLAANITMMADTLLAGFLIDQTAIAAVAVATPVINIFRALIMTIISGVIVKITVSLGRGERSEINCSYSMGVIGVAVAGILFAVISFLFARQLSVTFGGGDNAQVVDLAVIYIQACAGTLLFSCINTYFGKILSIYGYQKEVFVNALISITANIILSVAFVKVLPADNAIAGLGYGTCLAGLVCSTVSYTTIKRKKLPVKFAKFRFSLKEFKEVLKHGFPTSANNLADGVVSGIVNKFILAAFSGSATALSVYTVVKSICTFAQSATNGVALATAPLFGILYGARDKNGIKRTLREGYKIGLFITVGGCIVLLLLLPILQQFYGMPGDINVRQGVFVCFLFMPIILAVRLMTQFFESTEKAGMGILYSIAPDSVIYPIILLPLISGLGYTGIWLAYGLDFIIFLILLFVFRSIKNRSFTLSVDRLLCLDENIRDNVPVLDISIQSDNKTAAGVSDKVQSFLCKEGLSEKVAYKTALCLEEITSDFIEHTLGEMGKTDAKEIMDIKVFSDLERIRIIIRNAAKPYNPLDFDYNDKTFTKIGVRMVQKISKNIDYSYAYKMNIITLDLDK